MSALDDPYTLDPITNARMLRAWSGQIRMLLDAVAPAEGRGASALLFGPARSGRTSVLREVSRRAETDRGRLVVELELCDDDLTTGGLSRTLIGAVAERLVRDANPLPDWYAAWSDRVHLRSCAPRTERDVLTSALCFAADAAAVPDAAVLRRDLRSLLGLAQAGGWSGVVLAIDNADPLLEDVALTERFFGWLDGSDDAWTVLMSSRGGGPDHLIEAVSSALRSLELVGLPPLRSLQSIREALRAPLPVEDQERYMPEDWQRLAFEVARLTGGHPFEVALVARQLWRACRLHEQEEYKLTSRVLERVVLELSVLTGVADEDDGASALGMLPPEQVGPALELVALSSLSTRQIAIARALGLPNDDGTLSDRFEGCDLDEKEARVREELDSLEQKGVVERFDDRFAVRGGRAAAAVLKYRARSLLGPAGVDKPYGIPFLVCVGDPIACAALDSALTGLEDAQRLTWRSLLSPSGAGEGGKLRAALNAHPFAGVEIEVMPSSPSSRTAEILMDEGDVAIGLVDVTVAADGDDLDRFEVWELPANCSHAEVNAALAPALDAWQPRAARADLAWRGAQSAVLHGREARQTLIQLDPAAAAYAVSSLFMRWWRDGEPDALERATAVAQEAIAALGSHSIPDWERGWEISGMRSRLGFLLSLRADELDGARTALETAQDAGPADGWVTDWNLANIASRTSDAEEAIRRLDRVERRLGDWTDVAYVTFHVPGRAAMESVIEVDRNSIGPCIELQRAIARFAIENDDPESLDAVVSEFKAHESERVREVAGWLVASLKTKAAPAASAPAT